MKMLLVVLLLFIAGCIQNAQQTEETQNEGISMNVVKQGDVVSVDYVGTFDNGTVFDTSIKEEAENAGLELRQSYGPLTFTVGAGEMIAGFDKAVVGMKVNETKSIRLEPSEAYGEVDPRYFVSVPVERINGVETRIGMTVYTKDGAQGTVTEIKDGNATVDFNSPMAGKPLNFRITIKEIK